MIKRGRSPIRSKAGPKVKSDSQMSMDRKTTRQRYEANEIAKPVPSRNSVIKSNAAALKEQQSGLKRIRSSQVSDRNRAK